MSEPKFQKGQLVWFLKSMRMCEVVERHADGKWAVARLDTGKEMIATEDGLAAADSSKADE